MRVLHTSDWHLGHRLYHHDRGEEHRLALDWLLKTIREEGVELLIVAGDIFDSLNPSIAARNLYYGFLAELLRSDCRNVVIIGGNHDSPTLLDAPANLLGMLNVHVVGGAREDVGEQVFPIYARAGDEQPAVYVAAVPYLRDRDLRASVAGELASERVTRMQRAIQEHYEQVGAVAGARGTADRVPVIGTGHLFAAGCEDFEEKQSHIYLADKHNIEAGQFPDCFDYVALGHIHRAQSVGGRASARYSGSLVPLTFGEAIQPQSVCLFDIEAPGAQVAVQKVTVPRGRPLLRVRGNLEAVSERLERLVTDCRNGQYHGCCPWLEVRVETPGPIPLLHETLQRILAPTEAELDAGTDHLPKLLRVTPVYPESAKNDDRWANAYDLDQLQPEDVFARLCGQSEGYNDLLETFRELRHWMEQDEPAV